MTKKIHDRMNEKQIVENYSKMETEQLKSLIVDFEGLEPNAVPLLQHELFKRGETELAISITKTLISSKYIIIDDDIFDYLLKQVEKKLTENQLDEKLKDEFDFDQAHIEIIKAKFKESGKNNLFLGGGLILVPLIIGLIVIIIGGQIAGLLTIIIIISGIGKVVKGYKQVFGFKNE